MARIYIALTDDAAVARRDALDAIMRAEPNESHPETAREWASIRTTVQVDCLSCGRSHDALWTITRRAYDSGLYWPFVRVNGARVLLDASLPMTIDRLPRDARPVSPEDSARLWHEDNESHVFGGPNVARALRAAIAIANGSVR